MVRHGKEAVGAAGGGRPLRRVKVLAGLSPGTVVDGDIRDGPAAGDAEGIGADYLGSLPEAGTGGHTDLAGQAATVVEGGVEDTAGPVGVQLAGNHVVGGVHVHEAVSVALLDLGVHAEGGRVLNYERASSAVVKGGGVVGRKAAMPAGVACRAVRRKRPLGGEIAATPGGHGCGVAVEVGLATAPMEVDESVAEGNRLELIGGTNRVKGGEAITPPGAREVGAEVGEGHAVPGLAAKGLM